MDLSQNSDVLAVISILIAWVIYRLGVWIQRRAVLKSIGDEINLHANWVESEYSTNKTFDPAWKSPTYVVFKLSTTAIDYAIQSGPSLFLNDSLITALVGYKQRVNQFNQLIDAAMTYQANLELWVKNPKKRTLDRMHELTCQVHWYGIGDKNEDLTHAHFKYLQSELQKEIDSKIFPLIWLITNVNLFWLKKPFAVLLRYL